MSMTSTKRIFIRDCILNAFRRRATTCSTIAEIWDEQSSATRRKFSERDFLDVIGDLVAVGTLHLLSSGDLIIGPDAEEVIEPDLHVFAKTVTGRCQVYGEGTFAVIADKYAQLFPSLSAASSCAKEISFNGGAPGCIDLLNPGLGPGCDLNPLFFEKWERGELVRRNESNTVLLNIEGVRP
jgi:hypothetical protein